MSQHLTIFSFHFIALKISFLIKEFFVEMRHKKKDRHTILAAPVNFLFFHTCVIFTKLCFSLFYFCFSKNDRTHEIFNFHFNYPQRNSLFPSLHTEISFFLHSINLITHFSLLSFSSSSICFKTKINIF